jgi:hypothetical protein
MKLLPICIYKYYEGQSKKFPEMWYSTVMVGHMYGNFKVGLLRAHTLAPSNMPLLETRVERFFWILLEFGRRIRFDVLRGCKTRPLEAHFKSRKQPNVIRSEIW